MRSTPAGAVVDGDPSVTDSSVPDSSARRPWVGRRSSPSVVTEAAVALALLVWWWPLTLAFGGRDPGATTLGILVLLPALVLTRPWRLPAPYLLALVPGLLLALSVLWSPTAGDGLDEAAAWTAAGLALLVAAAFRAAGGRARWVLVPFGTGLLIQLWTGWWTWFGGGGGGDPMTGSFYWHNPFGAFMLTGFAVFGSLALFGAGAAVGHRSVAAGLAAMAGAGVLYSGSRACTLLALIIIIAWLLTCVRSARPWAAVLLVGGLVGSVLAMAWLLLRPLPDGGGDPVSTVTERDQAATGNARARWEYLRAASILGARIPWGTGADSFAWSSDLVRPAPSAPTAWVHQMVGQLLVDAGVLVALVVGALVLGSAAYVVVALVRDQRLLRRHQRILPVRYAAASGFLALLTHAQIDMDTAYPVLLLTGAVLLALALAPGSSVQPLEGDQAGRPRTGGRFAVVTTAVLIGLLASGGQDAAAPSGAEVPLWRTVATVGIADGDLGPRWTGSGRCVDLARGLVDGSASTASWEAEEVARCLERTAAWDPVARSLIDDLRAVVGAEG